MVEVVAENYHNIWAKKKKNELITKGSEVQSSLPGRVHFLAAVLPLCILNFEFDCCFQEEGPTPCWFPMIP